MYELLGFFFFFPESITRFCCCLVGAVVSLAISSSSPLFAVSRCYIRPSPPTCSTCLVSMVTKRICMAFRWSWQQVWRWNEPVEKQPLKARPKVSDILFYHLYVSTSRVLLRQTRPVAFLSSDMSLWSSSTLPHIYYANHVVLK